MRKCFERINGNVKVEPETSRRVSDLAEEVASRLLADNLDVDTWDLETLFKSEFGYRYALAWMREKSKSQNIIKE
jgi:hypothetical protein